VQRGAQGAGGVGLAHGLLHLTQDLRLAQHHRIQPAGHAEGVARGMAAFVHIGVAQQLVVRHLAHLAQPVHGGLVQVSCLACGADQATQGAVQLGAVAGGQQGHLGTVGAMPWQPQMLVQILMQTLQRRGELIHRERKASAQVHGGGGVVQPQGQDAHSPRL